MIPRVLIPACIVVVLGCSSNERGLPVEESTSLGPPTRFTGTLHSGVVAIGGEHTGWVLQGDGDSGGVEVDVSAVADRAKALAGKRVTITGRMSQKRYTERGRTSILMAEQIEESQAPPEERGSPTEPLRRTLFI